MRSRRTEGASRALIGVLIATALTACATPKTPPPTGSPAGDAVLGIVNGTTLAVTVQINGQSVGTSVPGQAMDPIPFSKLTPLPWTVEARSPSGRVLTSMLVGVNSVTSTTGTDGHTETSGTVGIVDLSCGLLVIWAGYSPPSGPGQQSPAGSAGDCAP